MELVPKLPPSSGYEKKVTAMDVFSRYLFVTPTTSQDAKTIARVIINIITKHAYLPTTIISDKGSAFVSQIIKEVAEILGFTLQHATTKHAQVIGKLERTHAALKNALKIEKVERRSGTHLAKTSKERMRTTPRVMLILMQASLRVRLHETLAQKMATTNIQEKNVTASSLLSVL